MIEKQLVAIRSSRSFWFNVHTKAKFAAFIEQQQNPYTNEMIVAVARNSVDFISISHKSVNVGRLVNTT